MAEGVPGDPMQCAAGATGSGAAAEAEVLESDRPGFKASPAAQPLLGPRAHREALPRGRNISHLVGFCDVDVR